MNLQQLKESYGVPGYIDFVAGNNGLTRVDLKLGSATSQVYLLGATVTSFQDSPGNDIIWLSETALFTHGKAIRGGIPICWPQFGPGALVQHGFARTSEFKVHSSTQSQQQTSVTLILSSNEETRKIWPFDFDLLVTVALESSSEQSVSLRVKLDVTNKSTSEFSFTGALHAYYSIPQVTSVAVQPLQHHTFFDKVAQTEKVQEEPLVTFDGETDRVYYKMPPTVKIVPKETKSQPTIVIENTNFSDVVVWNPGAEKQKAMADLSDWKTFVCVESAVVQKPISVAPGGSWSASQLVRRHTQSFL